VSEFSRRFFLKTSSAAVIAAGAVSAVPGLPAAATAFETQAPADAESAAAALAGSEGATLSEPVIAHVRDLATGEIGLFSGTREITVLDPQLAARLIKAVL
jgi:hypothetical protein